MKVNDRLIIGEDTEAKELYITATDKRIKAFKQLLGFCEALELKVDKTALYEAPADEFKRAFLEENSKGELSKLSYEKLLFLLEVDTNTLNKLIADFQANNNPFNVDTFEYELPSFDIVLEDAEHIARWKACKDLIESIEKLQEHQMVFYGSIVQGVRGAIIPQANNLQKLEPNLMFVRNQMR